MTEVIHKHHIIPKYKCKELGIDPDFDDNLVDVTSKQHALIHWGYKCNDLAPLLEVCNPPQYVIDMIPLGDNRDVGAAVFLAKGEIDDIEPLCGNDHPDYKPVLDLSGNEVEGSENWTEKSRYYFRKLVSEGVQPITHKQRTIIREKKKKDEKEKRKMNKEIRILWKNSLEAKEQKNQKMVIYRKKWFKKPKNKEAYNTYMREYMKERRIEKGDELRRKERENYAKKKKNKQGQVTLEGFMI